MAYNKNNLKKVEKTFGSFRKKQYLCTRFQGTTLT